MVLDLFAGFGSMARACSELGIDCYSIDLRPGMFIDEIQDLTSFRLSKLHFQPDMIWCSLPCTTYSIAGCFAHRDRTFPKSNLAKAHDILTAQIVTELMLSGIPFFIENPVGILRKMPVVQPIPFRRTLTYCTYGCDRMKPTDIFTSHRDWVPRESCTKGNLNCHHIKAPRGAKVGTNGNISYEERVKVPRELLIEILNSVFQTTKTKPG